MFSLSDFYYFGGRGLGVFKIAVRNLRSYPYVFNTELFTELYFNDQTLHPLLPFAAFTSYICSYLTWVPTKASALWGPRKSTMKMTLALPSRDPRLLRRLTLKSIIHERCIWGWGHLTAFWRRVVGEELGKNEGRCSSWGSSLTLPLSTWLAHLPMPEALHRSHPDSISSQTHAPHDSLSHVPHIYTAGPSGLHFPPWLFSQSLRFHDLRQLGCPENRG